MKHALCCFRPKCEKRIKCQKRQFQYLNNGADLTIEIVRKCVSARNVKLTNALSPLSSIF